MLNIYLPIKHTATLLHLIKIIRTLYPSMNLNLSKLVAEGILNNYQCVEVSTEDFINLMMLGLDSEESSLLNAIRSCLVTSKEERKKYNLPSNHGHRSVNLSLLEKRYV